MKSKRTSSRIAKANSKVMAIDCHNILHAAKHRGEKWALAGVRTGVIYLFLKKLISLTETIRPDRIVFAWDSKKSYREGISRIYKSTRHDKAEETETQRRVNEISYPQFDIVRDEVLPILGFKNNYIAEGYEADDILASVAISEGVVLGRDVVLVSTDNDLLQLLSPCCCLYNHIHRHYTTVDDFRGKWGLEPEMWPGVKAIAGDTGDTVPGCKGVGEKTAAKFLRGELKTDSAYFRKIEVFLGDIPLNLKLVTLPLEGTPEYEVVLDELNLEGFIEICNKYNMPSLLKEYSRWSGVFGGDGG